MSSLRRNYSYKYSILINTNKNGSWSFKEKCMECNYYATVSYEQTTENIA